MSTLISTDNSWMLFAILVVIAAVSIRLEQRFLWAAKVSACVLCLVFAMILANLRIIPTDAPAYDFIWSYLVPLAIPFLLFQADFRKIWRESGRMFGIYMLASLGTAAGGVFAYLLLKNRIGVADAKSALAMFVGTYVGGSVNLVAMADATGAGKNLVSASIVADNLLMVLYFFVLAALPASGWILKNYRHPIIDRRARIESSEEEMAEVKKHHQTHKSRAAEYWKARPVSLADLATGFAAACMISAGASGQSVLADHDHHHRAGNFLPRVFRQYFRCSGDRNLSDSHFLCGHRSAGLDRPDHQGRTAPSSVRGDHCPHEPCFFTCLRETVQVFH